MDSLVKRFDFETQGDLNHCELRGVAYQRKIGRDRVAYDVGYLAKCQAYADNAISRAVNSGRCALIARHVNQGALLIDVGAGSGAFIDCALKAGFSAKGFDVIPEGAEFLKEKKLFSDAPSEFDVVTLWDVIEHMEDPGQFLGTLKKGVKLFISVPIFAKLADIKSSKHYRPGEHLYYWTEKGFVTWMEARGFRLLETSSHEVDAGRESIGAFAFCKDFPGYEEHVQAYREIHSQRHYGSSAAELHLEAVAEIVRSLKPKSILDFGCGRSDLAAYFWSDGKRKICRYDPAIPAYKVLPQGTFDLVLCCDVMEHIPLSSVDRILGLVKSKGSRAVFTISTKLARASLPDGRNAHVTLLAPSEWERWIKDLFGSVRVIPSQWEHELILLAGAGN